jgi:hypothetical protein
MQVFIICCIPARLQEIPVARIESKCMSDLNSEGQSQVHQIFFGHVRYFGFKLERQLANEPVHGFIYSLWKFNMLDLVCHDGIPANIVDHFTMMMPEEADMIKAEKFKLDFAPTNSAEVKMDIRWLLNRIYGMALTGRKTSKII